MIVTHEERRIMEQKAALLKTLSHPVRLCIVNGLIQNPCCNVSKITECLDLPQSTISQHMANLKNAGIVHGERNGLEVRYSVVNEEAINLVKFLLPRPEPEK